MNTTAIWALVALAAGLAISANRAKLKDALRMYRRKPPLN